MPICCTCAEPSWHLPVLVVQAPSAPKPAQGGGGRQAGGVWHGVHGQKRMCGNNAPANVGLMWSLCQTAVLGSVEPHTGAVTYNSFKLVSRHKVRGRVPERKFRARSLRVHTYNRNALRTGYTFENCLVLSRQY